jgi:hypothetical protein
MTDMTALAAKYPSVAAKLKQANLTPQQHEAYRVALFGALALTRGAASLPGLVNAEQDVALTKAAVMVPDAQKTERDSALAKAYDKILAWQQQLSELLVPDVAAANTLLAQARNASWVEANSDALGSLAATGIWRTP